MTHINFNRLWFISRTEGSALKKLGGPTGESSQLRAVVLTHFQINRSDYLPRLVEGFRGPVYATPRTLGADGYGAVISNSNARDRPDAQLVTSPLADAPVK
jgi:phosphoribosyl 1,2-cyclic phosphodiesterase